MTGREDESMSKTRACQRHFDRAAVSLAQNPLIAPYLLGMAQAWRLAGNIDERTYNGMVIAARALHKADGRESA